MAYMVLSGILVLAMGIVLLTLYMAPNIKETVGDVPLNVATRLFGLILAAIAVQLIVEGLGATFPEWVTPSSTIQDDLAKS